MARATASAADASAASAAAAEGGEAGGADADDTALATAAATAAAVAAAAADAAAAAESLSAVAAALTATAAELDTVAVAAAGVAAAAAEAEAMWVLDEEGASVRLAFLPLNEHVAGTVRPLLLECACPDGLLLTLRSDGHVLLRPHPLLPAKHAMRVGGGVTKGATWEANTAASLDVATGARTEVRSDGTTVVMAPNGSRAVAFACGAEVWASKAAAASTGTRGVLIVALPFLPRIKIDLVSQEVTVSGPSGLLLSAGLAGGSRANARAPTAFLPADATSGVLRAVRREGSSAQLIMLTGVPTVLLTPARVARAKVAPYELDEKYDGLRRGIYTIALARASGTGPVLKTTDPVGRHFAVQRALSRGGSHPPRILAFDKTGAATEWLSDAAVSVFRAVAFAAAASGAGFVHASPVDWGLGALDNPSAVDEAVLLKDWAEAEREVASAHAALPPSDALAAALADATVRLVATAAADAAVAAELVVANARPDLLLTHDTAADLVAAQDEATAYFAGALALALRDTAPAAQFAGARMHYRRMGRTQPFDEKERARVSAVAVPPLSEAEQLAHAAKETAAALQAQFFAVSARNAAEAEVTRLLKVQEAADADAAR
ncbi:hypothetical protein T492DRAFT_891446 [Pavlovales sp. CCMP2436]|nr:hypothetical protein T492DRAFT_891446 [Pavlovales sp. CCMP2436]